MQVCKNIDTVYFIANNQEIKEAEVITMNGGLYTLKFDGHKGTRLHVGRLFPTYELAEQSIKQRRDIVGNRPPLLH